MSTDTKVSMDARAERFEKNLLEQKLVATGILIFGPLYLVMVFVAALFSHAFVARDFAIAATGISYLSVFFQYRPTEDTMLSEVLVHSSIAAGVLAGLTLLLGI